MTLRNLGLMAAVVVAALLAGVAAFVVVSRLALKHYPPSPEIGLAAAMAGLFAGGLAALLAILVLARSSPRDPR